MPKQVRREGIKSKQKTKHSEQFETAEQANFSPVDNG